MTEITRIAQTMWPNFQSKCALPQMRSSEYTSKAIWEALLRQTVSQRGNGVSGVRAEADTQAAQNGEIH